MKRSNAILLGILGFVAVIVLWAISAGNTMVRKEENVKAAWSQVENVYQRRLDLVPNLVNTVKGYAKHERETLENVIQARNMVSQATRQSSAGAPTDPKKLEEFQKAQQGLGSALGRLMVVVERYPDLKANQTFQDLQVQLEGTENRIAVERRRFGEAAQDYNSYIRLFPASLIANFRGFKARPYFEAQQGAATAPKVEF